MLRELESDQRAPGPKPGRDTVNPPQNESRSTASNRSPPVYKTGALPTELDRQVM